MIFLEILVLVLTFVPFISNLYSGKCLAKFRRYSFEFRPILYSSILIQVFLLLMNMNSWGESKVNSAILVILGLQIAVLFYETIFIKSGVHERGIIVHGLFYEWSSIADCLKGESEDWSTYIVIKHINGKSREIAVDGAKADEIYEMIKSLIAKRKKEIDLH